MRDGVPVAKSPDIGVPTVDTPWCRLVTFCGHLEQSDVVPGKRKEVGDQGGDDFDQVPLGLAKEQVVQEKRQFEEESHTESFKRQRMIADLEVEVNDNPLGVNDFPSFPSDEDEGEEQEQARTAALTESSDNDEENAFHGFGTDEEQDLEVNDKNPRDDSAFVEGGQDFEEEDMEEQEKQELWEREEYLVREGLGGKSALEVVAWLEGLNAEDEDILTHGFVLQLLHLHNAHVDSALIRLMWRVLGINKGWVNKHLKDIYRKYLVRSRGRDRDQLAATPGAPWCYMEWLRPGGNLHRPKHLLPPCAPQPFPRLASRLHDLSQEQMTCNYCGRLGYLTLCSCTLVFYCGESCREEDMNHVRDCQRLEEETKQGAMLLSLGLVSHKLRANRYQGMSRTLMEEKEKRLIKFLYLRKEKERLQAILRKREGQLRGLNREKLDLHRRSLVPSSVARYKVRGRQMTKHSTLVSLSVGEGEQVMRGTRKSYQHLKLFEGSLVQPQHPLGTSTAHQAPSDVHPSQALDAEPQDAEPQDAEPQDAGSQDLWTDVDNETGEEGLGGQDGGQSGQGGTAPGEGGGQGKAGRGRGSQTGGARRVQRYHRADKRIFLDLGKGSQKPYSQVQ